MSKSLLSSLRRGVNLNRKTASAIFSTFNSKALNPKQPYVVGVTNTYCVELFNVAVAQLRKNGVIPATTLVRTPSQLSAFLTDEQCAIVQAFIAPRPKNRSEGYSFENAEVTFVVARKGDKVMNSDVDVAMTHSIADLLQLPVDQILVSKVGAVDPDSTPAVIIQDADPFGGAYAGMLPNSADQNDDFDEEEEEEEDDTVYSAADAATLNRAQIEKLLGAAAKFTKSGNPTAATLSAVVGKPKLV